jgi:superfamily II DNA/RNA helicase
MPPAVERLARKYMRKPIVINIGRAGQVTDNVTQRVFVVKENEKAARLEQVIKLGSMVKLSMKFKMGMSYHSCVVSSRSSIWSQRRGPSSSSTPNDSATMSLTIWRALGTGVMTP